jgi:uncharacterized protein
LRKRAKSSDERISSSNGESRTDANRKVSVIILSLFLPGVFTWLYFEIPWATPLTLVLYGAVKVYMILVPLWVLGLRFRVLFSLSWSDLRLGLLYGACGGCMIFLTYLFLKDSYLPRDTSRLLVEKLKDFQIDTGLQYLFLAVFISLFNSFLEELFFRGFLFGELKRLIGQLISSIVTSAAFMIHHVFVLNKYLPNHFWDLVIPFSLAVFVAGLTWCTLFQRTGKLTIPWISHLVVDLVILGVGYEIWSKYQLP